MFSSRGPHQNSVTLKLRLNMGRRNSTNKTKKHNQTMKMVPPGAGSTSILSKLFTQVMYSTGIASPNIVDSNEESFIVSGSWSTLMDNYLSDARNSIPQNIRERSSARGNLQKEILNNKGMSWRVFIKAMRFLGALKFDLKLVVQFEHSPNKEFVFTETINLGHRVPYPKPLPMENGKIHLTSLLNDSSRQLSLPLEVDNGNNKNRDD